MIAHVAFLESGQPYCIPLLHARVDDTLYLHGSTGGRTMRTLAGGAPACVTVTVLDGLVLARSVFEHSANYRSAVLLGRVEQVPAEQRSAALHAFTERLVPGRWDEVRPPTPKELAKTTVLAMTIGDASVKVRSGPPSDGDSADAASEVWAGVLPLTTQLGPPRTAPELRSDMPLPASVQAVYATSDSRGDR